MEQKKKNPIRWFRSQQLSYKVMLSVGILIFCSNLLILLLVYNASTSSLRKKSCEHVQDQISIALSTVSSSMDNVTDMMIGISTTAAVKDFVNNGEKYQTNYLKIVNDANESMRVLERSSDLIDYVALLRTDSPEYLYIGELIPDLTLSQTFIEHYDSADVFYDGTGITGSFLLDYYQTPMLNLYCPLYQRYAQGDRPVALLVVGINPCTMRDHVTASNQEMKIRLLNSKGMIITSSSISEIGTQSAYFACYQEKSGEFSDGNELIAFQTSEDGLWMADGTISQWTLFAGLRRIQTMIFFVIFAATVLSIILTSLLCNRFYTPMEEILYGMTLVSEGNLDAKMKSYEETDFNQISEGFNQMTTAVKGLIASIQRREQENTEIRLNALQSQIKPHFLYNTLECIHWQSLMAGDSIVSEMVMALSKYYRLCLSKGQDIVSLSQEIEHTQSYVTIQNIRFDDILDIEYDIPEALMDYPIPKITLQPLVENAIYHGIKVKDGTKGKVRICGNIHQDCVLLTVEDNGAGMTSAALKELNRTIGVIINDGSYGVKNVHQRISFRYGAGYGLQYSSNEYGGVTVTIRLPILDL